MNSRAPLQGRQCWGGGRNHGWQGPVEQEWSDQPSCLSKTEGFPETRKVLGTLEWWVTLRGWGTGRSGSWGELSRSRVKYPKLGGEPGLWSLAWSPRHLWHSLAPQRNGLNSTSYFPCSSMEKHNFTPTQRHTHMQTHTLYVLENKRANSMIYTSKGK